MGYTVEIELLENNIADRKAAIKERNEELKEEEEAFNTRKVEAELQAAIAKQWDQYNTFIDAQITSNEKLKTLQDRQRTIKKAGKKDASGKIVLSEA